MYEFDRHDVLSFANYVSAETKEKGNELFFKRCPYCNGGKKDYWTISINLDNGTFNCFRAGCGKKGHFVELARDFGFALQSDEPKKYKELPQKKIKVLDEAVEYMKSRGISEMTTKRYNITASPGNRNVIIFPFYDEQNKLQFIKYRNAKYNGSGNKEWTEKDTKPILFGMAQCENFGTLVITEGQIDSLTLAECGIKNAVSVPTGALGFTWLANCWDWILKFREVVVFGDNEHGKITLIDTLAKRLPMKVKCVKEIDYLCEKDANDIFRKYGKDAIVKAVKNAELREVKFINRLANIKNVNIMELPKIRTGIMEIDRTIGGLYYGQVILISGKRGEGKSTFMSQIVAEAIEQDNAVFVYSGELPNYHFKNWLDLQIAGGNHVIEKKNEYGDMQYILSEETTAKINNWYYDKAFIYDNSAVEDDEFEGLLKIIADAICRYSIKLVCIDNLMTALDDDISGDLYRQQSRFIKELAKMAKKYDVAIILIAHPKKSKEAFDNDTVSGSANITNAVDVVINYERAKPEDECDSKVTITKNRLTGRLLTAGNGIKLIYSDKSKRIQSAYDFRPEKEYSCFKPKELKQFTLVEGDIPDFPFEV